MSLILDGTNGITSPTPLAVTSGGTGVTTSTGSGSVVLSTNPVFSNSISTPNTFGFKNRFINGKFQIAQRNTSGTAGNGLPTTTATYPSVDRWFAYYTGAAVTVAQVAGSGNNKNLIQATGAASVTAIGIGQRIEANNCYDLAGQTVTLSASIANSLLTTVTWTAYYAGSTDVWTSSTQIATGTFTVSSTLTTYSTQISIPSAATTGLQIIFSVGSQTSGTFQIGNAQLELGSIATPFDQRDYGRELMMCQRYCQVFKGTDASNYYVRMGYGYFNGTTNALVYITNKVNMRSAATSLVASGSFTLYNGNFYTVVTSNISLDSASTQFMTGILITGTGYPGAGVFADFIINNSSTTQLTISAEL
jgi:hypothetical protein